MAIGPASRGKGPPIRSALQTPMFAVRGPPDHVLLIAPGVATNTARHCETRNVG